MAIVVAEQISNIKERIVAFERAFILPKLLDGQSRIIEL